MTIYELGSSSTVYMDGTAIYHVRQKGVPGIVSSLRLHMGEVERVEILLRMQAEQAWEEGAEAEAQTWPDCAVACGACGQCRLPAPVNPYTAEAQVDGL